MQDRLKYYKVQNTTLTINFEFGEDYNLQGETQNNSLGIYQWTLPEEIQKFFLNLVRDRKIPIREILKVKLTAQLDE
jgi:hypothetical protein